MADRSGASSSVMSSNAGTERVHSADFAGTGGESVITEFLDAAREAAESLLEEQKRQIAGRTSGIAEALRSGAHPLHASQNGIIARYLEEAARQVDGFSRSMRERSWGELLGDTEEFARRRPTLFVLSAAAIGFVAGRLLWSSTGERQHDAARSTQSSEPTRTVTAAVSSGSGTAAGELTGNTVPPAGAVEAR